MLRAPITPPRRLRHRHPRGVLFVVLAALTIIGSLLARPVEPAAATPSDEAAFVAALNAVRADHGLPPFTVNTELSGLSRGHAQVMADAGEIFHADPISAGFAGEWRKLGENVGVGAGIDVLVDAFVASPGHFANIVDPSFTEVGVGVVWKDSALYTTHRFLQPPGATPTTTAAPAASAPPAPTPTPTPTAAPAPAPTTTTTTTTPLTPPAISAARVIELLEMLDRIGT